MKKIKKLTALISALTLAVCAVPANVYAEDVVGDWDGDGVICTYDCIAYLDHIIDVENGTVGYKDAVTGEYFDSERLLKWVNENHDVNGDGVVDKRDFVIVSQQLAVVEPATENTKIGDVNHDKYINRIDGYMIKYYLEDVAEGNADFYTEEQIANFNAYGDIDEDGDVDETDAELIITKGYIKPVDRPVAKVSFDEYMNDDSDSGDVNHDGFVDAVDASIVSCFYAYLSTRDEVNKDDHVIVIEEGEDGQIKDLTDIYNSFFDYTEEQIEDMYAYGDVNKDECVNAIDASLIMNKYARNSTQQ